MLHAFLQIKQYMLTSILNLIFAHLTVLYSSTAAVGLQNRGWVYFWKLLMGTKQRFPKYGSRPKHGSRRVKKWVSPRWFKYVKMNFFLSFFKFFQFRHRLNYCIIRMSFGFVLLKLGDCIVSGFPRVLMAAAQLLAVTSHLAAKLRFVDYGSILELNSSVNRSVEYHG